MKRRSIIVIGVIMAMGLLSGYSAYAEIGETVRDTIEYLEVGEAVHYEELTIIPIHSTRIKDYTHYVTLDMALKNNYLQILEIDGGNVPEVMLSNISDKTIYIMGGEILTGCKQDRIVGKDLLIRPKGKKVLVPVYCVEAGRWFHNSKEFYSQKNLGTYKLRAAAQGASALAQQEIWDEVENSNKKMSVRSSTNAYQDVYKDKEVEKKIKAIEEGILRDLELEKDTIGVAVGLGDRIISVDIFANPYLFKEMWPKILKSSALSAASDDGEVYISREAAVYLTDPDIISSRVNFVTTIMWILIVILFTSIIGGGVLVLKTLNSEIVLARQKTTFVANVSHELKTPLTSIRMFAEMLKQGKQPDKEKQARYFDIMVSETERLTRLINNILDFSRMDSGKKHYNKKRVDISRLCFKLVESEHIRAEQNGFKISFKSTVKDSKKGIAYADEEAIKQALLNLLSNAEKYSDKEKDINVETGQENNFLYIDVKDRGRGIPPRHVKKIFNEFYRIDDSLTSRVKGTGLGLSIARRIIRDHGGDIKCFPRDGGGSVFRIKLPVIS